MERYFLSLLFCLCAFLSYSQEDLTDYLVGEYEVSGLEDYSHKEENYLQEGFLEVIKIEDSLIRINTLDSDGDPFDSYLIKIREKNDKTIILEIPKHTSPLSRFFIHEGRKEIEIGKKKVHGYYNIESKELAFFIFTDKTYVKKTQTTKYFCQKINKN